MFFEILTLFPEALEGYLATSIVGRAIKAGLVEVKVTNIRDFALDKHQVTDDRPYGGGEGMLMKPEPLAAAIRQALPGRVVLTSPRGRPLNQAKAERLSGEERVILVCGRYEGVDQRIIDSLVDEELSIGDYVLTGGELAALVILDATVRLLPGVLGAEGSSQADSFSRGLLEHPHYTRPQVFEGREVPGVLLSGDHARIERWRRRESLKVTLANRPDLLETAELSEAELNWLEEIRREAGPGKDNG